MDFINSASSGYLFHDGGKTPEDAFRLSQNARDKVGDWVRNKVGVTDPRIQPSHAWRHRFKTQARNADVDIAYQNAICGHASGNAGDDYGDYTKQLLAGVNARDWEAFSAAMTSMFFGGLFYVGQQILNAQGRPDKQEWLEERLSTASIGKAAFQRAAFSSFIPMGVDFLWGFGGGEPVFDYRSSGLRSGGGGLMASLLSNPTADLIQKAQQAGQGATASFLNPDYDFSQRDWWALSSTLFFQNAFIVRNGLYMMSSGLPRYSY